MSEQSFLQNIARHHADIKSGALAFDYRTGACSPVQATQTRSWGAGCPSGFCPPADLPLSLGRWFAGDRSGCSEKPFTVRLTATSDAALDIAATVNVNASVTMCPTRIIMANTGNWQVDLLTFGNQNQMVGGPAPSSAFGAGVFAAVPLVPDCIRAGLPITINATLMRDGVGGNVRSLWVVFLGPMVG
jgi:hypothetical protein